jgi:dimethylhistidine N-methyltransferase
MALNLVEEGVDLHNKQRSELLAGLLANPKYINAKFFYDERGSQLFGEICELPEYYPTRTEIEIFKSHSAAIARVIGPDCELLEPGAGGCEKVRHLIADLQPAAYRPMDISRDYLLAAAGRLSRDYPGMEVTPVVADFSSGFELPDFMGAGRRVLFYPGSTIGNFMPDAARAFLVRVATLVGAGGGLLIGVDLHKDTETLNAAYNDAQGVTGEFNRNILHHANRLLGADFMPELFDHVAFYNEEARRIEMHLESQIDQDVDCGSTELHFAAGERLLTEYSYKYSLDDFSRLAASAGFTPRMAWVDERDWFSVQYFELA